MGDQSGDTQSTDPEPREPGPAKVLGGCLLAALAGFCLIGLLGVIAGLLIPLAEGLPDWAKLVLIFAGPWALFFAGAFIYEEWERGAGVKGNLATIAASIVMGPLGVLIAASAFLAWTVGIAVAGALGAGAGYATAVFLEAATGSPEDETARGILMGLGALVAIYGVGFLILSLRE